MLLCVVLLGIIRRKNPAADPSDSRDGERERCLFDARSLQHLLPLHDTITKPKQEDRAAGPHLRRLIVSRDLGFEPTSVAHALDNARHERGAIEHAHFPRHADVGVDQWVVVGDHVFIRSIRGHGVLEGVCGTLEEEAPEGAVDEMEQGDYPERTVRGEEEVEELESAEDEVDVLR